MENKYLTKVCALLRPFPGQEKSAAQKPKKAANKYEVKISKMKKPKRLHDGGTTHRSHKKVYR